MNKAAFQYIQLVYFYRLLLVRHLVLFNLVSLLAESLQEEEPSLDENQVDEKPRIEPVDCFEKGRIGLQVTGKELDEETGYYYFGARYYDPKISSWISTDPALGEYLPTGKQLFFPEEAFKATSLKGSGGVFNSKNINLYQYGSLNPIKYFDPDGKATFVHSVINIESKDISSHTNVTWAMADSGDSIWDIARQFKKLTNSEAKVSDIYKNILSLNKISNPDSIKKGDLLLIEDKSIPTEGNVGSAPFPFKMSIKGFLKGIFTEIGKAIGIGAAKEYGTSEAAKILLGTDVEKTGYEKVYKYERQTDTFKDISPDRDE